MYNIVSFARAPARVASNFVLKSQLLGGNVCRLLKNTGLFYIILSLLHANSPAWLAILFSKVSFWVETMSMLLKNIGLFCRILFVLHVHPPAWLAIVFSKVNFVVATISRLLKIIGLFRRKSSLL